MMMKTKKFRRRAGDEDESDTAEDGEKSSSVKPATGAAAEKPSGKDKSKQQKPSVAKQSGGPVLLSFAEDEEFTGSRETETSVAVLKGKRDKSRGKPGARHVEVSLLSFEEEDQSVSNGLNVSKAKKKSGFGADKSSSHRLGLGKDKSVGSSSAAPASNVQALAGEYTKEKLLELQRNTIRLGGPTPVVDNKPLEPVVVLKGLVKPLGVTNGNNASDVTDSKEILGESIGDVSVRFDRGSEKVDRDKLRRDNDDAETRLGLMGIGIGAESGGITHIPDAAAIAAAKAKRERLRQAQAAPDYISLATGDADLRSKLRESALVREHDDDIDREEDDSSSDEGEVQGRLAFLGDQAGSQKRRVGVFESAADQAMEGRSLQEARDEEEEDEERRWEDEQLRKGFGKRVEEAGNLNADVSALSNSQVQNSGFVAAVPTAGASWGFGRSSEVLSLGQQAEVVMRTLQENLQRMREKHARSEAELHRTQDNLSLSIQTVSALEKTLGNAGERYIFMQELRDYISILCDFLQDKAPLIEELEEHMQRLHEERADAITERRVGDNADEMAEVEAAVGAAKAVLSKGGGTATATSAAAAAAAALSARDFSKLAPQLDEFGRDVNLQKRMESKRRAEARSRRESQNFSRRSRSEANDNVDVMGSQQVEGECSSEESESEATAYQMRREEVLETAGRILGDATEEFAQLEKVKQKLEKWKSQYRFAYRDAYVSLSAPAIFAPYVRLELLQWDPLYGDAGFSNMQWYQQLFDYGMSQNGKELDKGDVDGDLVPKLVEKVALPILHHEIAHCWDRLSTEGTRRAVEAVNDVLIYVPASSEALQELLSAVRVRMTDSVAVIDVPTWNLQVINAVPQAARLAAQKFGTSVRLLRNIGMWKDVLAMPVLEKLALDELLSGKILPHLRNFMASLHDAVTRTERVIAALAGVWVGSNKELSPKLASLVEYVTLLTRVVEKKRDGGASSEDSVGLARRVKRMLVELNEYDRARQLVKHFQLREAL